jgi:alpha-aminoadipate carrier protein LysW
MGTTGLPVGLHQENGIGDMRKDKGGEKMAECPVCGAEFTLSPDTEEGEIISCEDCGSELEVTGEDSVAEAPHEEEDWGE